MSIDLVVWEGSQPESDEEAQQAFEGLWERYGESEDGPPPTERITAFVNTLLTRYPDITELGADFADDSPWASGPLIEEANGPFLYFPMVANEAAEDAWAFAVATAREMGLVCFDPQSGGLAE